MVFQIFASKYMDYQLDFRVVTLWRRRLRDHLIPDVPSHGCSFGTELLSPTVSEEFGLQNSSIFASKYIWAQSWLFRITWCHRIRDRLIPQVPISYRYATVALYMSSRFQNSGRQPYRGHDLDLSRSRDVINHVTIWFAIICHLVLMVLWNQAFISIGFRDNCIQIYLGHDLDLLGSCDIISHMAIASWNKEMMVGYLIRPKLTWLHLQ